MPSISDPRYICCPNVVSPCPILPKLFDDYRIPLVGCRTAEREAQTDHETGNRQEDGVGSHCEQITSVRFGSKKKGGEDLKGLWPGLQGVTNSWMQVIQVDHPPTKNRGSTILGRILPCIRRKTGHFECFWRSRGPVYTAKLDN